MSEIRGDKIFHNGEHYPLYKAQEFNIQPKVFKYVENPILRPYQRYATNFLLSRERAILADEVGLGKTPESLFAAKYLIDNNKVDYALIVTNGIAMSEQWANEIKKFINKEATIIKDFTEVFSEYNIINYEKVLMKNFTNILYKNYVLILDECNKIKNDESKTFKSLYRTKARYKFLLSGTPFRRSLLDYYSYFKFLNNDYFGSKEDFIENYAVKERKFINGEYIDVITGWKNIEDFAFKAKPVVLRRLYNDVFKELPMETIKRVPIQISDDAYRIYKRIGKEIENESDKNQIFKKIIYFKQYLDTPELLDKKGKPFKIERLLELLEDIIWSDEKIIIFSQFVMMGTILKREIENKFGVKVITFSRNDTKSKLEEFEKDGKILVTTDKAQEGLDLQYATILINYDLPWNPADIEQRIGRIGKARATKPYFVYNMVVEEESLIERYIESVLNAKALLNAKIDLNLKG
jgi:SNF2 family DNA or RNA helicase